MTTSKTADSPLKTAIGLTTRTLSTTLRLVASGASWGARVIDESRTHLEGGGGDGKTPPRPPGQTVHYVNGELCCVVAGDGLTRDTAPAFYDALWGSLNESASGLVREWLGSSQRESRPTSFDLDMAPALLGRLSREGRLRQYVGRLARRPGGHPDRPDEPEQTDEPFVVFEGERGAPGSLVAFCDAARFDGTDEERRLCVPEIVNLLNANVERVNRELVAALARGQGAVRAARVEALTPNWLAAGAGEFTDAGPGTAPLPGPAQPGRGHWQVEFDRVTVRPLGFPLASDLVEAERVQGRNGARSDVLVAVLDTCPLPEQVTRMADAHPENTLLHDVAHDSKVRIGELPSIPTVSGLPAALADPGGKPITLNWREHLDRPGLTDDDYLMTDHGVFAAGIVRDIAPRAEIRLIRVLDDYGVGDLLSLIHVMRRLPKLMEEAGCEKLVVNLSLVIDLPPDDDLLAWWFPRTSRDSALLRKRFGDVCRIVEMTHASLDRALSWLRVPGRNVLVVAAAGNDHTAAGAARPSPRWPARYDRALGVAAVDSRGGPAHYSNKGDFVVLGNGVATFGGDALPGGSGELPDPTDPMIGLFTAEVFPLRVPPAPPTPNTTSWARWAGTSFATPLISGLAAAIWASEAGANLAPEGVIDAVRGYATTNGSDLDCPYVPAYQRFVSE